MKDIRTKEKQAWKALSKRIDQLVVALKLDPKKEEIKEMYDKLLEEINIFELLFVERMEIELKT